MRNRANHNKKPKDLIAVLIASVKKSFFFGAPELSERSIWLVFKARRVGDLITQYWLLRNFNWIWVAPTVLAGLGLLLVLVVNLLEILGIRIDVDAETAEAWWLAFSKASRGFVELITSEEFMYETIVVIMIFTVIKIIIDGTARTKIHDRYKPLLKSWADGGNPDAAFELARKAAIQGSDWWCRHWLRRAAELGHKEAARHLRRYQD